MFPSRNVLGTPLKPHGLDPVTGWFRDGCCNSDASDRGSHTVAAIVTNDFLLNLADQGNDLITPAPQHGFSGLRAGDRWCVCAGSWLLAAEAGKACPIDLECTHEAALQIVPLDMLMAHAWVVAEA